MISFETLKKMVVFMERRKNQTKSYKLKNLKSIGNK